MPSLETLLAFTLAALAMNLAPGPSNLYVLSRSMAADRRAGLVAVGGLALGSLVHVLAAAAGISAILAWSPTAYTVLKLAGAGYLIWLGIRMLRDRGAGAFTVEAAEAAGGIEAAGAGSDGAPVRTDLRRVLRESIVVEVTNPKTAVFFLAFLPPFVDPSRGSVTVQLLVLGTIVTVSALPCDLGVAWAGGRLAAWMERRPGARRWPPRISGILLLGLGGGVAVDEVVDVARGT